MSPKLLDCTLRDGGYHNAWDFAPDLVRDYLAAMGALGVDAIELGFRFLGGGGYRGPLAYTTDRYLESLSIPEGPTLGVMINAGELTGMPVEEGLERLFAPASDSLVDLVRIASHHHELDTSLAATRWLRDRGYRVGLNLMQISERTPEELREVARKAAEEPPDILYFADSLGSLTPPDVEAIVRELRNGWSGEIGIHTHDNIGNAVANSVRAAEVGAAWVDGTVTGMGRGAGNAQTEYLAVELETPGEAPNYGPLLELIQRHFEPLRRTHRWGTNFFYYLAGRYGIHPTYIQEMLTDRRYTTEDLHSVIERLRREGGARYTPGTLASARNFYAGEPRGSWHPRERIEDREVLVLATGPGVARHRRALEDYVAAADPLVIALNTQDALAPERIHLRAACHPMRLLADARRHLDHPQPLVAPSSMLPDGLRRTLESKEVLDYGLAVEADTFRFGDTFSVVPAPLVMAYVLAVCAAGRARRILLAGFDGYPPGDPRNEESESVFEAFAAAGAVPPFHTVTPSRYRNVPGLSIYHLLA